MRVPRSPRVAATVGGAVLFLLAASGRAVIPPGSKAYVSDTGNDSITMTSLSAFGGPPLTIPLRTNADPRHSVLSPSGDRLYVAMQEGDSPLGMLAVIDTASDALDDSVLLSLPSSHGVATSLDGTKVYVSSTGSSSIAVVSGSPLAQSDTIGLPQVSSADAECEGLARSPSGTRMYAVARNQDVVHVIDTVTDQVTGSPIAVGFNPRSAGFNGAGTRLLVIGDGPPVLIDASNDSVVATALADIGTQVAIATAGNRAVVVNTNNTNLGGPSLDVYDLAAGTLSGSVTLFGQVRGVTITPDGTLAWVSTEGIPPQPPTLLGAPTHPRTPETAPGSVSNPFLVEVDPVNLAMTGNLADLVSFPGHVTGFFQAPPVVPTVSYFLPKKVNLARKGEGKDSLALAGFFDDGGQAVDYTDEVTVEAGSFSRSFTLVAKGAGFKFKDGTLAMTIKPNLKGSSRGAFKMKISKTSLDIDPGEDLALRFQATGLPDCEGTVALRDGKYTLGKVRGALLSPAFFPSKASVTANDGKPDVVSLKGGFSTGGATPGELGAVTVALGPDFSVTVPGGAFVDDGDVFRHVSKEGGQSLSITLDYARELLTVKAKGYEVGDLDDDTVDVLLDPGDGNGAHAVTIRMASSGTKRKY